METKTTETNRADSILSAIAAATEEARLATAECPTARREIAVRLAKQVRVLERMPA